MTTVAEYSVAPTAALGPEFDVVPYSHPFRLAFREWLAQNVPRDEREFEQDAAYAQRREWQRILSSAGWAGPAWPSEFGGQGAGPLEQFMYYEELALARAPEPGNMPGLLLLGPTLMVHGTSELKERFLPGIMSGDEMWCQGFSEPDAGSDLVALRTRAELDGDEWVINGGKIWTSYCMYADYCFVLCRTDQAERRHHGLTLIICPMDQPGVTVQPIRQMTGEAEFGQVFFNAARVPRDWTVGGRGEGWPVSMTLLGFERADIGFTDHARHLVQVNDLKELLQESSARDLLSAAQTGAASRKLARLWVRSLQLRRMNLRVSLRVAQGEQIGVTSTVAKLVHGILTQELAELNLEIRGNAGLLGDTLWTRDMLSSRSATIASGSNEVMRNVVAERILGLPRR